MRKVETSKTEDQKVLIHRERTANVLSQDLDLIDYISYLSSVGPPQAVAGLGGGNGDNWRGARHTVAPGLGQKGP